MRGSKRWTAVVVFAIGAFVALTTGQDTCGDRPTPCTPRARLPDPENCGKFYECSLNGEKWQQRACGNNDFDSVSLTCVPEGTGACFSCDPLDIETDPSCVQQRPCQVGSKLGDPTSCNGYYECTAAFAWTQQECDPGLKFDISDMTCVRASTPGIVCQPLCPGMSLPTSTTTPTTTNTTAEATTTTTIATTTTVPPTPTTVPSTSSAVDVPILDPAIQVIVDEFHQQMCTIQVKDPCTYEGVTGYPNPSDCSNFFLCSPFIYTWAIVSCFGKQFDIVTRSCQDEAVCLPPCPDVPTISTTLEQEMPTTVPQTLYRTSTESAVELTTQASRITTAGIPEPTTESIVTTEQDELDITTESQAKDHVQTTAQPPVTTEPSETTARETTESPVETTKAVATTSPVRETTEAPIGSTEAKIITTETIEETTEPPVITTEVIEETTEVPVTTEDMETTESIDITTVAEQTNSTSEYTTTSTTSTTTTTTSTESTLPPTTESPTSSTTSITTNPTIESSLSTTISSSTSSKTSSATTAEAETSSTSSTTSAESIQPEVTTDVPTEDDEDTSTTSAITTSTTTTATPTTATTSEAVDVNSTAPYDTSLVSDVDADVHTSPHITTSQSDPSDAITTDAIDVTGVTGDDNVTVIVTSPDGPIVDTEEYTTDDPDVTTQPTEISTEDNNTTQEVNTVTPIYEATSGTPENGTDMDNITRHVFQTTTSMEDITTQTMGVTTENDITTEVTEDLNTLNDSTLAKNDSESSTVMDDLTSQMNDFTTESVVFSTGEIETDEVTTAAVEITSITDSTTAQMNVNTTRQYSEVTTQENETTTQYVTTADGISTDTITQMLDVTTNSANFSDVSTRETSNTSRLTTSSGSLSSSTISAYLSSTSLLPVTSSDLRTTDEGEASSLSPGSHTTAADASTNDDVTLSWVTTEELDTSTRFTANTTAMSTPTPTNTLPVVQFCEEEKSEGVNWSRTPVGQTDRHACPNNLQGEASRECLEDQNGKPVWAQVYLGLCVDLIYQVVLDQTMLLLNTDPTEPASAGDIELISSILNNAVDVGTNVAMGMSSGNLNASMESLGVLVEISEDVSEQFVNTSLTTTGNILSPYNQPAWEQILRKDESVAVGLMNVVDQLGNGAAEHVEEGETLVFVTPALVVEVVSVTDDEPADDLVFDALSTTTSDSITLPAQTLQQLTEVIETTDVVVWSAQFTQLGQYLPTKGEDTLGSNVIGLTVANLPEGTILEPPIQMTFTLMNTSSLEDKEVKCVFWHYTSAKTGYWDDKGCTVITQTAQSIDCECNHLTNFAVLISPYIGENELHQKILSIIGVVGCLLSILGSLITLCLYAIAWKRVNSQHAIVMLNLCLILIISNTLFLVGIEKTDHELACTVIAAALHYFYLVAMMLMLADGIYFVLYVVYVFHTKRRRETLLILLTSWMLPAVIVGLSLSITKLEGYGTPEYCWLAREKWVILAFIIPVIVIIVVNFFIFVKVLKTAATSKSAENKNRILSTLWNVMVILPLLGITWVFGLLSVNEHTIAFQYVFSVCNALQGFFIFLCHCALNKKVREAVAAKFKAPSSSNASLKSAKSNKSKKSDKSNKTDKSNKKLKKEEKKRLTEKPKIMTTQLNGTAGYMDDPDKTLPLHHGRSPILPRLDPNKVAQNRRYRAEQATLLKQRQQSVKSAGLPDNGTEFMTYSPQFIDTFDNRCYEIGPRYIDMGDTKYYDEDDNPEDHIYMEIDNPTFNTRPENNWINFPDRTDRL